MPRTWRPCLCGCGYKAGRWRNYKPGHDQTLRTALEAKVGGLYNLRVIVEGHLAVQQRLKEVTPK